MKSRVPVLAAKTTQQDSIGRISAMKNRHVAPALCALALTGLAAPAQAQNVLTTHRLSAALASEAATAAVAACAKQGYKIAAAIVDADGVEQAVLRGDGATMTALDAARDKAYTAFMLGAPRNENSSGAVASRIGANATAGGLAKLPHILLLQGGLVIRASGEAIAAIGVGGAPGGNLDEGCAKAGLDAISDRLK
jgi:uncharacterized protein GlcG (DUF336 family)